MPTNSCNQGRQKVRLLNKPCHADNNDDEGDDVDDDGGGGDDDGDDDDCGDGGGGLRCADFKSKNLESNLSVFYIL